MSRSWLVPVAAAVLILAGGIAWWAFAARDPQPSDGARQARSDALLRELTPHLATFSSGFMQRDFPGDASRALFEPRVHLRDLSPGGAEFAGPKDPDGRRDLVWPRAETTVEAGSDSLTLWRPLLRFVESVERCEFRFRRGHFPNDAETSWDSVIDFTARARATGQVWLDLEGQLIARWHPSGDAGAWRIGSLKTVKLEGVESP